MIGTVPGLNAARAEQTDIWGVLLVIHRGLVPAIPLRRAIPA
jgi:hypothetical protein